MRIDILVVLVSLVFSYLVTSLMNQPDDSSFYNRGAYEYMP